MKAYDKEWHRLNAEWHELEVRTGDLRAPFQALHDHQVATGFIRNGISPVQRFEFCHPEFGSRCFRIQFNPGRATRFAGAGVRTPPAETATQYGGCFLCRENIRWQQEERQFGFELDLNGRPFIAWMNPFPLMPGHLVVATRDHESQEWSLHPGGTLDPARIAADVVELVHRAPGYAGFYNGVEAGASIPAHMHYQMFRPLEGHSRFPLELEAMAAREDRAGDPGWRLGEYPVESMHWYGGKDEIIAQFAEWIERWAKHQLNLPELAANIIAINDGEGRGISLFFVPRDRRQSRVPGPAARVGGLEVLGEIVFSTPEEQQLLESGKLDFFNLEQVLAGARTSLNMP